MTCLLPHPTSPLPAAAAALLDGRIPILVVRHGSNLYGTATPESDEDMRMVFLPHPDEVLLGRVDFSLDSNRASRTLGHGDTDVAGFTLARFLMLLAKFDMNAIEILFAAEATACLYRHPLIDRLLADRERLIARGTTSAVGHARSILGSMAPDTDRYARTFRDALDLLPADYDDLKVYKYPGLIDALVQIDRIDLVLRTSEGDQAGTAISEAVVRAGRAAGATLFVRIRDRMVPSTATIGDLRRVLSRPLDKDRRDRRARQEHIDVSPKDLYHALRLLSQAVELCDTGRLTFPRPERQMLMALRRGELSGPEIAAVISETFEAALDREEMRGRYPDEADVAFRDALIIAGHRIALDPILRP